jgi:hypothetical protein
MGVDGLLKPAWLSLTFKDVREDLQATLDDGKRLTLIRLFPGLNPASRMTLQRFKIRGASICSFNFADLYERSGDGFWFPRTDSHGLLTELPPTMILLIRAATAWCILISCVAIPLSGKTAFSCAAAASCRTPKISFS